MSPESTPEYSYLWVGLLVIGIREVAAGKAVHLYRKILGAFSSLRQSHSSVFASNSGEFPAKPSRTLVLYEERLWSHLVLRM